MSIDGGLHGAGEIAVWERRVAGMPFIRLRDGNALAEFAARAFRSPDDRDGPVVPLDEPAIRSAF